MHPIHRNAFTFARLALGAVLGLAFGGVSIAQQVIEQAAPPKAVWPDNGIAQRVFSNGSTMFVDNDRGKLRAWVLSETTGSENVEALDFFSGQRMRVKVDLEEDGKQAQSFTDAKGDFHSTVGGDFQFSGTSLPIDLPGMSFDGSTVFLKSSANYCSSNMTAATSTSGDALAHGPIPSWSKFPVYHLMGSAKNCLGGSFDSKITSALDLNDGTFLAVEGCFVFRLHKSDLSPVGSAPALRVIDESAVQAAIKQAEVANIQDATGYVAKTLSLPITPELSCKES